MTNDAMGNWIDSLPTVPSDDPRVVPAAEHIEEAHGDPLGKLIGDVQSLNIEARSVFMLHSEAVRGQLLTNPKVRNALDQFLWELAKDEELGNELRKRNPNRYAKPQAPTDQS